MREEGTRGVKRERERDVWRTENTCTQVNRLVQDLMGALTCHALRNVLLKT